MCVAYPGRIVSVDGAMALVETEGRSRTATTMLVPEAVVGDWVVVSAGAILRVLDHDEAVGIRQLLDSARHAAAPGAGADRREA